MREDLRLEAYAQRLGYTIERTGNKGDPLTFHKDNAIVWECVHHKSPHVTYVGEAKDREKTPIVWMTARLIDFRYTNHRAYATLKEALDSLIDPETENAHAASNGASQQ